MTRIISFNAWRTRDDVVVVPPVEVLRERIAAAARYRNIHGHEVWIVFKYDKFKNVSNNSVLPCSWLKYTNNDQCNHHVLDCSWLRADFSVGETRLRFVARESMTSRSVFNSSSAPTQLPVRMSEASLPQ
jgi:hypothetical protein